MTNEQIIADIAATIYGEDTVMTMLATGEDIPLHTLKGWAARGPFRIKKGEHGLETKLWKKRKDKVASSDENENTEEATNRDFYMAKAFLFRADQVERIVE
ncbi:MAG: hypothetical protein IJ058_06540 [Lachnospiraceae bacterium]|nr:hypothetical protein [Lachnospiraceae bacterium]